MMQKYAWSKHVNALYSCLISGNKSTNKSNSTARTWRVETNLPWTSAGCTNAWEEYVYIEKFGQDHRVQHSQCSRSMANINVYESHILAFFASSRRFRDIYISEFANLKMYVMVMRCNVRSGAIQ